MFNIPDEFEVYLVNARHIKHVPGRKTDVCDSEWICKLLRAGLLRGSFIPHRDIRKLRDLTRYERKLTQTISAEMNRVQKVLEDANIKLSYGVSDTFGVSGSDIIDALIPGETNPDELAERFTADGLRQAVKNYRLHIVQRGGYLLELLGDKRSASVLESCLNRKNLIYTYLSSSGDKSKEPKNKRWKLIINEKIEISGGF